MGRALRLISSIIRFVNVQTVGGIDDQYVIELQFGLQRAVDDVDLFFFDVGRKKSMPTPSASVSSWPGSPPAINVRGNHQHFLLLFFFQELAELIDAGGFTGALQAAISTTAGG